MSPVVAATIIAAASAWVLYRWSRKRTLARREHLIDTFRFPEKIGRKLRETYPQLSIGDAGIVLNGLREYFHLCNIAGKRNVAMPSQAVDVAWHEFILFTRQYETFCTKALGRFLHHTPAEAMRTPTEAQDGIKRAWKLSCRRENIAAAKPQRLPILFAMDAQLKIPDGFTYTLDCKKAPIDSYCAGHIGCGGCTSDGCSSDGGSSDGCGGGGCGGD